MDRFVQLFWFGPVFGAACWTVFDLPQHWQAAQTQAQAVTALFYCLVAGSITSATFALVWTAWLGSLGPRRAAQCLRDRLRQRLAPDTPHYIRHLAWLYSLPLILLVWVQLAVWVTRALLLGVANSDNAALSIVLALPLVALVLRVLANPAQRGTLWLLKRCGSRVERHSPVPHVIASLLLSGMLGLLLFVRFLPTLRQLGQHPAMSTLLILAVALTLNLAIAYRSRKLHRALTLGSGMLLLTSGAASARYTAPQLSSADRRSALADMGAELVSRLLDVDHDGHIHIFGGRDCQPTDPAVHPGAADIPANGVDEDCDGADAVSVGTHPSTTFKSFPLPNGWPAQPDLYLITIDAFSPSVLTDHDAGPVVAANVERFRKQSVEFENFFVQGPSTRLSLPSMFTSRFDSHIQRVVVGRFPYRLHESNLTVAEVLGDAGYRTAAVLPAPYFLPNVWGGLTQGFDRVEDAPALAARAGVRHTARHVTDRALEVIQTPRDRPLFLWVHYFDAHPPHETPDGYAGPPGLTEFDRYRAEMSHLDRELGRLLAVLTKADRDHFVILTGDHGIAFDPPRHQHVHYGQDLSTAVLHVPLMVFSARLAPRRVAALSHGLDLAPTLINLAHQPRPASYHGHSLVGALLGHASELPKIRFAQFYISEDILRQKHPLRMVSARTERYNMVLDRRTGSVEAWDWRSDPFEQNNLWHSAASSLDPMPDTDRGNADLTQLRMLKRRLDRFVSDSVKPANEAKQP